MCMPGSQSAVALAAEMEELPPEFECQLCFEVLVEPVVLPCGNEGMRHRLCGPCFEKIESMSNLECPFCKQRLSNWIRRNRKNLVNQKLWAEIRRRFARAVEMRLNGEESQVVAQPTEGPRCLAKPGELRAEYERSLEEHEAERRIKEQEEYAASQRLLEELARESKEAEQALVQQRADEDLARKLRFLEQQKTEVQLELEKRDRELAMELSQQFEGGSAKSEATQEWNTESEVIDITNSTSDSDVDKVDCTERVHGIQDVKTNEKVTASSGRWDTHTKQSTSDKANTKQVKGQTSLSSHVVIVDVEEHASNIASSADNSASFGRCPLCSGTFEIGILEEHAAACNGELYPPDRRSTHECFRGRTSQQQNSGRAGKVGKRKAKGSTASELRRAIDAYFSKS